MFRGTAASWLPSPQGVTAVTPTRPFGTSSQSSSWGGIASYLSWLGNWSTRLVRMSCRRRLRHLPFRLVQGRCPTKMARRTVDLLPC